MVAFLAKALQAFKASGSKTLHLAAIASLLFQQTLISREAQLFVGWVSGSVTHADVGFHASTQPTFILYLIPPTHLISLQMYPFFDRDRKCLSPNRLKN